MRFSELEGRAIGVWGAGRETRSLAATVARRLGSARIAVVASDRPPDPAALEGLARPGTRVVHGADCVPALLTCDVVVRSPGVSIHRGDVASLGAEGMTITTATALWFAEAGGAGVIGVTGTKGKSTTSTLVAHLARRAGASVHLAGNIGVPVLDLLDAPAADIVVVELSSYQIADLGTGPEVAVVTNLHPEHLDWHLTPEAYRREKLRLLTLPGVRAAVLNGRDPSLAAAAPPELHVVPFGVAEGWDATDAGIAHGGRLVVPAADVPLPGHHNALNVCAALAALGCAGLGVPPLPEALTGVAALPHRLEPVGRWDGVLWVDDSISTTPESTLAALACFPDRRIVLVGGGQDRGQIYEAVGRDLAARGAAVVGVPDTGARLVAAARDAGVPPSEAVEAADLSAAVAAARRLAGPGGVVLLSPAAPSYNAYRSFEARGDHFRTLAGGHRPD